MVPYAPPDVDKREGYLEPAPGSLRVFNPEMKGAGPNLVIIPVSCFLS